MARTKAKAKRRSTTHRAPADEQAATELVLYIENTSELSPDGPSGQGRNVLLNALRKWKKGTYDSKPAVKLFEYLAEAGAKQYAKEFGQAKEWSTMFTPATRHEAAKQLEASFRNSAEHGEYDHIDTRVGHHSNEVDEHVDARGKTRLDKLRADLPPGYAIYTYSPGDGVTRYRFFKNASPKQDYFGPANGIYTALGYAEAEAFAQGLGEAGVNEVGARRKRPPERPAAQERKHSMTYGVLPPFEQFAHDVHTRADPDESDGSPYWPSGTLYPMELVNSNEIALAQDFGGLDEFRTERHRTGRNTSAVGFRGDERQIYDFLEFLVGEFNEGNEEAGDLASSIMTTLGYEWI
jgi:hypothetical protein